jgi:hypothetical protein
MGVRPGGSVGVANRESDSCCTVAHHPRDSPEGTLQAIQDVSLTLDQRLNSGDAQ